MLRGLAEEAARPARARPVSDLGYRYATPAIKLSHQDSTGLNAVTTLKRRLEREPNSENGYVLLASCYGHLGQIDAIRSAWAEVLKLAPDFTVERRWGVLPFKNPSEYGQRVEGLRKAGLPV